MYIENAIVLRAEWNDLWRFASEIEHWVERLPHYRRIDILEIFENGRKRKAYMSCWRDLLPLSWPRIEQRKKQGRKSPRLIDWLRIPESWTTVQTLLPHDDPAQARILYNHIGGPTKGMEVVWSFQPLGNDSYRVTISHDWRARWPLIGGLATRFIQTRIVHDIADKTLKTMQRLTAEAHKEQGNILSKAAL
jgi:ribosome-associated toxin RatA of RatAB toxin-antitoxin module